jgi:hypothetical protein
MPPPFSIHATTYPAVTIAAVNKSGMYMYMYNRMVRLLMCFM